MKALRLLVAFMVALPLSYLLGGSALMYTSNYLNFNEVHQQPVFMAGLAFAAALFLGLFHGINKLLVKFT